MSRSRSRSPRAGTWSRWLALGCWLGGALPACGAGNAHRPSTVAEGKYYSSGHPQYDEFFIGLYSLQVQMKDAPLAPEAERRSLAEALGLGPRAPLADIAKALRERALTARSRGVSLRLEQQPVSGAASTASAVVRSHGPLREQSELSILPRVESSASALLRSIDEMKSGEAALAVLERKTIALDAGVSLAFSRAPSAKRDEVKSNLMDAHRLLALMRARASDVRAASEAAFSGLSQALDTDDGSIARASAEEAANVAQSSAPTKPDGGSKHSSGKPSPRRVKPASTGLSGAPATPSQTPRAKPPPAKAAAASRDFEP